MSVRSSIISGIEIAATFSGVPYLGGAATILRSINDTCDKMALSKVCILRVRLGVVASRSRTLQEQGEGTKGEDRLPFDSRGRSVSIHPG